MTTPNTIISDLAHEIDRLQKTCNLLLAVAIRVEQFMLSSPEYSEYGDKESAALLGDLRYAIEEAHHG